MRTTWPTTQCVKRIIFPIEAFEDDLLKTTDANTFKNQETADE